MRQQNRQVVLRLIGHVRKMEFWEVYDQHYFRVRRIILALVCNQWVAHPTRMTSKEDSNNEDFTLAKYGDTGSGGSDLHRDCIGSVRCLYCNRSNRNLPHGFEYSVVFSCDRGFLPRIRSFWVFYKTARNVRLSQSDVDLQRGEENCHVY